MESTSSDDKKICSLSISFNIVCDGLIGGKYEYNPYVAWHTSFGDYRVKELDPLVKVGETTVSSQPGPQTTTTTTTAGEGETIRMDNKVGIYESTQPIELVLVDYDEMKGDDAVHLKLFTHTRYSGVASIDKNEGKYVERQIADGFAQLTLHNLFSFYKDMCSRRKLGTLNQESVTFAVTDTFDDQKIIDEKSRDLLRSTNDRNPSNQAIQAVLEEARPMCRKGTVTFNVTVKNFKEDLYRKSIFNVPNLIENHFHSKLKFNHQNRDLSASSSVATAESQVPYHTQGQKGFESILFNSQKSWGHWMKTMNDCLEVYCAHFIESKRGDGSPLYKPFEAAVSNLQLPQYASDCGKMPVYGYWSNHDPFYREYASEKARLDDLIRYGFDANTESFFRMVLRSTLRRFGLKEETLVKEIEEHFSCDNPATKPSPNFLRVEQAIAHIGTFGANMANYTADFRFMAEKAGTHAKTHKGGIGEMRNCAQCGKEMKIRVLSLDSWDNNILNNTSNCDDCEGQDNTATSILRSFAIGRFDLGFNWESPELRAVKKFLDRSVIYDVGALVTSAFMDTNNKKIEERQEELPLIGSDLDKNAQNDGHCFGLLQSMTRCVAMLEAGNTRKEVIDKIKLANRVCPTPDAKKEEAFRLRDSKRSMLVLEPTGSIEARLLSLEESYDGQACEDPDNRLFKKVKSMFYWMKQLRPRLKEYEKDEKEDNPDNNAITDLFVGEGLPHYLGKQVAQRRVSSFYNSIVHGSSVDLMRFDPTLSQFAFCTGDKYGVRIGTLIRDTPSTNLSLVCPYADYKEQWMKDVVPMVESIQNQMPIMKFGRYSAKEYADEIYSRYVSPDEMCSTLDFKNALPQCLKRDARQNKLEALIGEVDSLDSNKMIVRLYSRVWKLNQKKERTERLNTFIKAMPGLIDYGFYIERHLPVCDPIVEILCVINVDECLALPINAK